MKYIFIVLVISSSLLIGFSLGEFYGTPRVVDEKTVREYVDGQCSYQSECKIIINGKNFQVVRN